MDFLKVDFNIKVDFSRSFCFFIGISLGTEQQNDLFTPTLQNPKY